MYKILIILTAILACSICSASDFKSIKLQVLATGATVDNATINIIVKACRDYNIPCKEFTAMLAQESMFQVSAVNKKSKDYGIGQVNVRTIAALGLNKDRLITDAQYSIYSAARVFKYFWTRYGSKELLWYCRYNVGTGDFKNAKLRRACLNYATKVQRYLNNSLIAKD